MIGFFDYTVWLTYASLISAVVGIFTCFAGAGHPYLGAMCLLFSGLCDAFDGKVARTKKDRTPMQKKYGIQIDSLADIIAFAENLTNKMLASPVIAKAKKKPRIVVGSLKQNTHDENLRVQDIHDRIQEVLFNSGAVRVMDRSATNFDYIMQSEITDIVTRAPDGQKLVDYTMKIKLFNLEGELVGQWSDDLSLFKSR